MIKNFTVNGKHYFLKTDQNSWSHCGCLHENGLKTWAGVHVYSSKIKRQDVIDAIERVDSDGSFS